MLRTGGDVRRAQSYDEMGLFRKKSFSANIPIRRGQDRISVTARVRSLQRGNGFTKLPPAGQFGALGIIRDAWWLLCPFMLSISRKKGYAFLPFRVRTEEHAFTIRGRGRNSSCFVWKLRISGGRCGLVPGEPSTECSHMEKASGRVT